MAEVEMKQLIHCALCPNMCRFDCPVLRAEKNEATAPSFKARMMYLLKQGFAEADADVADIAYHCVGCEGCKSWCEFPEVELAAWVREWRSEMVAADLAPEPVHRLVRNLRAHGNPFEQAGSIPAAVREVPASRPVEFVYYAGCVADRWQRKTVQVTQAVFDAAGLVYEVLSAGTCCGYAAMATGEKALARQLAERLAATVRSTGAAMLVTGCPECYEMFAVQYPLLGVNLGLEILHSTELFDRLLREGRLRLTERSERVVVHDPCVLGRKLEKYDALRNVLARVPGIDMVELRHNRKHARCCGGGGMMADVNPALSRAIAQEKAAELEASGAPRAITSCPHCERNLEGVGSIPVLDVADLLAERLK